MDDEKRIAMEVSCKLSNLMVQDSVSLLGLEDELETIEAELRKTVHNLPMIHFRKSLREIVYDIEDVIDLLLMKQLEEIEKTGNFLHCFLHLFDFIDQYKLEKKLEEIKLNLSSAGKIFYYRESWWNIPEKDLDLGETIISPVILKAKAVVREQDLSPVAKRKARWLKDEFISLHEFLKILQVNELSESGTAWMEEVHDVCRAAEDVFGFFLFDRRRLRTGGPFEKLAFSFFHVRASERKLSKEMDRIKTKMDDISGRSLSAMQRTPEKVRPLSEFRSQRLPPPNVEEPEIIPIFDGDIHDVMEMLLSDDPNCLTISISGMEGTGKTSLAKLIYENHTIIDHFRHRVWVANSGSANDLMTQIAGEEYLRLTSAINNYDDFLNNSKLLLNAALKSNKYLIVIDDVRSNTLWNELAAAFDGLSNGTRVIFTSRKVGHTPQSSDRNFTYRLQLRSDEESWTLFTHILQNHIPMELLNLKKEIVRRCGGLPLMIKKLADLLSKRDSNYQEWSGILKQFNKDEGPWSRTLYEINKKLPLYLRRCLFHFRLFPEDYEIPARRLIALWVAEGLGRRREDKEPPEWVSQKCLMELINRNMIQVSKRKANGDISKCRVPDVLRLRWLRKAKEANFLQDINLSSTNNSGGIRRLADHLNINDPSFDHIHGNNNTSSAFFCCYRNTVSFLSFDTREGSTPGDDIGNFLERCISKGSFSFLWVLDLEQVYKPKLPKVVGQLTRLRYLGLRSTYLEKLPAFIDRLLNLQTLDLKRTCMENVPSTIWKMQSLRHLFLDETFRTLFVPRQADSSLVNLQTLWGAFVDEDSPVRNGLDTLSNVTKLGLKCKISTPSQNEAMSVQLEAVANWITNTKCLKILRLKSFDESNQPWDLHLDSLSDHKSLSSVYLLGILKNQQLMSNLPRNLIELTLSASGLEDDPLQKLDKLPNLRILKLLSKSFTGSKMKCSYGGFPKLEILKFWGLELLVEWIAEEKALPRLKDLEIRSCRNLKDLPDGLQHIKSLRDLRIAKSPELSRKIKDNEGEDSSKIRHICNVWIED